MKKRFSVRYSFYLLIVIACLLLSVLGGRIEPIILATPLCLTLIMSASYHRAPRFLLTASWAKTRGFEGDDFVCTVHVDAKSDLSMIEVFGVLPPGSELNQGTNDMFTSMRKGESKSLKFGFSIPHRGVHRIGGLAVRIHHPPALRSWETVRERDLECVVYPLPETIKTDFRPFHTQVYTGNYVSKTVGDGIEFADMRPLLPGESPRRINWRATARAGELVVNEFAVERNADVVLLVDTFADMGVQGHTFLDYAARGAGSIAHHFVGQKNRVGLIEFGCYLSYLPPRPGMRQWYDISDRLSRMAVHHRHVSYEVATLPRRILPPRALVLAFTTFLDDRFLEALVDLKGRGFDIVAIFLSPVQLQEKIVAAETKKLRIRKIALRIWRLENTARMRDIRMSGIRTFNWDLDEPFTLVMRSLDVMRKERLA